MKVILVLLTFLILNSVYALEIDEKLTLRFLKVSNSKKTILINRGAEDGLTVGDHAKFFITSGVIARGVVEKVSPSRSIWSLYRVVDPAEVIDGKVLNLKIASPVKITDDSTKNTKEEAASGSEKMSLSDAAAEADTEAAVNESDKQELEGMGLEDTAKPAKKETGTKASKKKEAKEVNIIEETPVYGGSNNSKNWEVWGALYVNSLSGTINDGSTASTSSTATTASMVDFSAGIEKYFLTSDSFLKNTSFTAFVHKRTLEIGDSAKVSTDWFEYGGGANYHFYNSAASTNKIIGFGGVNLGIGSVTIKATANGTDLSQTGTNTFFSAGLGGKYVLSNGFGARAVLDYYSSSEKFIFQNSTTKRTLSGPRVQFGISYRF